MILDVTEETIRVLLDYVEFLRKHHENQEEYEECAEMRDLIGIFGNFVIGYLSVSDIEQVLYNFCTEHSSIKDLDTKNRSVIFELYGTGQIFVFHNIKPKELKHLQLTILACEELKNSIK